MYGVSDYNDWEAEGDNYGWRRDWRAPGRPHTWTDGRRLLGKKKILGSGEAEDVLKGRLGSHVTTIGGWKGVIVGGRV